MTKDYKYVLEIQNAVDCVNDSLFHKKRMELSLTTEISDNKTWCILSVNGNKIYAAYAKDFQTEIIWALDHAFHFGYMQAADHFKHYSNN